MSWESPRSVDSEYHRKLLSFAYSTGGIRNSTIEAASLFRTHSDLDYNGEWRAENLIMEDDEVEDELMQLMRQLNADISAYRFLRDELSSSDLSDRQSELYEGVKTVGDDIVIDEVIPLRNQYNDLVLNSDQLA